MAADDQANPHAHHGASTPASNAPWVEGTVKGVDAHTGTVTLDHGRIENIDMDAMTMAYRLQNAALAKDLKVGDRVRFSAEMVDDEPRITRIERLKGGAK
ncbi:copper-binding protein [Zemynaea arenosa]|nr:copper-binding protein [Massilia arenosa]